MNNTVKNGSNVDVICQHKRDGTVMPIKIRVVDDCGEYQTYIIRAYKNLTSMNSYSLPDGIVCNNNIMRFECKIIIFDIEKKIQLLYNAYDAKWRIFF